MGVCTYSISNSKLHWQPRLLTAHEVTGAFALHTYGAPSAASYSVAMTDCAMSLGEPFYAEVSDALIVFGLVGRHNY